MNGEMFKTAPRRGLRFTQQITAAIASAAACVASVAAVEAEPAGMPSVEATAPSEDPQILEMSGLMSDGAPIRTHVTDTIATSIEMDSFGAIGGVSVDRRGNVYNTNFQTKVWRTSPGGATIVLSDAFTAASGNYALEDGDLLQADFKENRIYRIAPNGDRSVFAQDGLDGPVGIVQRTDGDFIVANYTGKYLARVPAAGGAAKVLLRDDRLQGPNGVTIDPNGNIYIADLKSGIVFKWTPRGDLLELAELPGKGNAHNVIANGALYVNKIWDHVIYRVELDTGAFGVVAGNGRPGYDDGGTGIATIEEPNGIAVAPDGRTIYFNTHRGEMFSAPGLVILRRLRMAE